MGRTVAFPRSFRRFVIVSILFPVLGFAQTTNTQSATPAESTGAASSEPAATFRATTRMVTLEVVARDRHGRAVLGLTPQDFQVFESTPSGKKQMQEQKIASFQSVSVGGLASASTMARDQQRLKVPAGVYTNLVSLGEQAVPPTILLVDGINTELKDQQRVHTQMIRMLRSLPKDAPIAVFLLGHQLLELQSFTTDPALLKAALEKASAGTGSNNSMVQVDPRDNPDSLSALIENRLANDPNMASSAAEQMFAEQIKRFEKESYSANMDTRVRETIDAFLSLARNISGYPGRKNLLWLSSSFPLVLAPEIENSRVTQNPGARSASPAFTNPDTSGFVGNRDYQPDLRRLTEALSEAKLAVYPIDVGGVKTETFFDASSRPRARTADTGATAVREMTTLDREATLTADQRETMESVAAETGGRVCAEDNDLSDCIHRAISDGNDFYEIAYYPTSPDWNGEFRKVFVKTTRSGVHLAYREGYFAQAERNGDPKVAQRDLQQAACLDYLNSTSLLLMGRALPDDSPDKVKFYVVIDVAGLTFAPGSGGTRTLNLNLGVCTFDKSGKPLRLLNEPINRTLTPKEYDALLRMRGFAHGVMLPGPKPASVRLVVQDIPSGHLGSINIPIASQTADAKSVIGSNNTQMHKSQ